jgi:hypothetical protein
MGFQFPTDEKDRIDVDGMLSQIHMLLRPGGRLIMCGHEFTQLDEYPDVRGMPFNQYLKRLSAMHSNPSCLWQHFSTVHNMSPAHFRFFGKLC